MRLQASTTSTQDLLGQFMTTPWVADKMAAALRAAGPWRILDPACGDGNLLMAAVKAGNQKGIEIDAVIGYDVDPDMIEQAATRLVDVVDPSKLRLRHQDFLGSVNEDLSNVNVIIANPPYGRGREYRFFEHCADLMPHAELMFLVPLAFLDRVTGVSVIAIPGRPLGVTTGNAIANLQPGERYAIRGTREPAHALKAFRVLTGAKLYERGAGDPPQTDEVVRRKAFSSDVPREGWLPCARTGDVTPDGVLLNRLWVNYGKHLAHPKELGRFTGPRLFVRRVPIWEKRQLSAAYIEEPALAAGDLLVVKHVDDDRQSLREIRDYINSPEAAEAMHVRRPSVLHRSSFPKFSSKDLAWLIHGFERSQ